MMIEAIGALATIAGILQTMRKNARAKAQVRVGALMALSGAVAATSRTLTRKFKTRAARPDLVAAWRKAGLALELAGERDLGRLCRLKGMYWLNRDGWTQEQVKAAGIQLRAMELELRRLLAT